jgi:coiled-coil domain-containing protein 130
MGRYVPPEHEGITSANKLAGKHALGSRARNLQSTGALTVRFEMPFPVWCGTCKPPSSSSSSRADPDADGKGPDHVLIGQGVRFNAQKKKVGNYYSTPIWSFRMKHSVCGGWIEIRTDPQNAEYVVVEGGRRKAEGSADELRRDRAGLWIDEGSGVAEILVGHGVSSADADGKEADPFAKFETKVGDERAFLTAKERMDELRRRQARDWEDPYEKSRQLRKTFRVERRKREAAQTRAEGLKDKMSLGIELVDEKEEDMLRARMVDFGGTSVHEDTGADADVARIQSRGIFDSASARSPSSSSKVGTGSGKKKRRKTAAETAAERKHLLQRELTGNTRAAIDPFLSDQRVWQPEYSLRRKTETRPTSQRPPSTNGPPGEGMENAFDASPTNTNAVSQQQRSALVAYDSDSD